MKSTNYPSALAILPLLFASLFTTFATAAHANEAQNPMYIYTLKPAKKDAAFYDEVAALVSMQGIVNRIKPILYVDNPEYGTPTYWLDKFSSGTGWLQGRKHIKLGAIDDVFELARPVLKGAIIWDPEVPATFNVATTAAGVEDAVVMSPEFAAAKLSKWKLQVLLDLRGKFTGSETGSKKNDAYRWAIRQYIDTGKCSPHWLSLYTDPFFDRQAGQLAYNIVRDMAVSSKAFVFDLSPWGDEKPADDLNQRLGLDLETYKLILSATQKQAKGKQLTEVTGFFSFGKYANVPGHPGKHDPVPTEWETVWLITPYNCYQNTATEQCYNQSFHRHAPLAVLKQPAPGPVRPLQNKAYVSILMADYDSAYPLYSFLPKNWDDAKRGTLPLNWGINPNLLETYPDIISSFYASATPNDHFVADASAAGYFNPNRILPQNLPLFVKHNAKFYRQADMTISGMVLDWDQPTAAVKDAFTTFSSGGFATIVMDLHGNGGKDPAPHMWKGMPVTRLLNNMDPNNLEYSSKVMFDELKTRKSNEPGFYYFRCVWVTPTQIQALLDLFAKEHPDQPFEIVGLPEFFSLFKQHYGSHTAAAR